MRTRAASTVWSAASIIRLSSAEKILSKSSAARTPKKVIKSDSKRFPRYRRVTPDQDIKNNATHYKEWYRPIIIMTELLIQPPHPISRATPIDSDCCRLPMHGQRSQRKNGRIALQPVFIGKTYPSFSRPRSHVKLTRFVVSSSMAVEALSYH